MPTRRRGGVRRGAGRPASEPERGAKTQRLMVRVWADELRYLRDLGEGDPGCGLHRLIAATQSKTATPQPGRGAVVLPPASRLPQSITAWDDDEGDTQTHAPEDW